MISLTPTRPLPWEAPAAEAVARGWFEAMAAQSPFPRNPVEIEQHFVPFSQRLLSLMAGQGDPEEEGGAIGAALARLCYDFAALERGCLALGRLLNAPDGQGRQRLQESLRLLRHGFDQQRERQAASLNREVLRRVAHDLNTPMNTVVGISRLMLRGYSGTLSEQQQSDVQLIHDAALGFGRLLGDLIAISTPPAPGGAAPALVDATALLAELAATLRPTVEANGNRFLVLLPDDLGQLALDAEALSEALSLLLAHGARFTGAGTVRLEAAQQSAAGARSLHIVVQDDGVGMSAARLAALRGERSAANESALDGFDLALRRAARLCHGLGGSLEASSAPGQGSCFTVAIPA